MSEQASSALRRFILWDYPRGSRQYDIIVVAILAFIFATPRSLFRDQPRASSVVQLPADRGANVYWLEAHLLDAVPEADRPARANTLLRARTGKYPRQVRVEPVFDEEHELRGYLAFAQP